MRNKIFSMILSLFIFSSSMVFGDTKKINDERKNDGSTYNTVIIGGGVGSLTSGIYLARSGNIPLIIEGPMPGGLITQSQAVENWPGDLKIKGVDLADKIKLQAQKNGCIFSNKEVIDVDFSKKPYIIYLRDGFDKDNIEKIKTLSCIIAMGTTSNYLNIPGEKKYWGKGVSNCALCDGSLYKDKKVAIIGGGDAAISEAEYLSNIAQDVFVIVRKDVLKTNDNQKLKNLKKKNNIKIIYNTNVVSINGDDENITSIDVLNNNKNQKTQIKIDGVFLAIGSTPNTKIFQKKLQLDEKGYIIVDEKKMTSKDGVFAVGDIIDPIYKQAITAAGDGAKAAISCQKMLASNAELASNTESKILYEKSPKKKQDFSSSVVEIKSLEHFEKELNSSNLPILIDFYASWCGPCKRIAPILEQRAKFLGGKVKILKVNVEKNQKLSSKFQIKAMPTVLMLNREKNILFKKMGTTSISDLLNSLEKVKDKNNEDEIDSYLKEIE